MTKQASKRPVMVVGACGDYENVRTVNTPEEWAELMGGTVERARELMGMATGGGALPCFILPGPVEEVAERTDEELRDTILRMVTNAARNLLYYDLKDCEELNRYDMERAIAKGIVTLDEIIATFRADLVEWGGVPDLDDDAEAVTVEGVPRP